RCKSVLLPEPEAPTMARVSPAATARSTLRSTCTSRRPSVKRLLSARACNTMAWESFITQRLRRVHAACTPAGINRRHKGQDQGNHGNRRDVGALRLAGHLADQ